MAIKSETGTASYQSTVSQMTGFTLTGGADASVVTLKEGSSGGTSKYVVKAAIATTVHLNFGDEGVQSATGAWYVTLTSGTTPQMTIAGR